MTVVTFNPPIRFQTAWKMPYFHIWWKMWIFPRNIIADSVVSFLIEEMQVSIFYCFGCEVLDVCVTSTKW